MKYRVKVVVVDDDGATRAEHALCEFATIEDAEGCAEYVEEEISIGSCYKGCIRESHQ